MERKEKNRGVYPVGNGVAAIGRTSAAAQHANTATCEGSGAALSDLQVKPMALPPSSTATVTEGGEGN